jgi:hypothetical protein
LGGWFVVVVVVVDMATSASGEADAFTERRQHGILVPVLEATG